MNQRLDIFTFSNLMNSSLQKYMKEKQRNDFIGNKLSLYKIKSSSEDFKTENGINHQDKDITFYLKGNANVNAIFKAAHLFNNGNYNLYKTENGKFIDIQQLFPDSENLIYYYNFEMNFCMGMCLNNDYYPNSYIELTPCAYETYTEVKLTYKAHNISLIYKLLEAFGGFIEIEDDNKQCVRYDFNGIWQKEWNLKKQNVETFSQEKKQFFVDLQPISLKETLAIYYDDKNEPLSFKLNEFYPIEINELDKIFCFFDRRRKAIALNCEMEFIETQNREKMIRQEIQDENTFLEKI